jgi:hypothetical protein
LPVQSPKVDLVQAVEDLDREFVRLGNLPRRVECAFARRGVDGIDRLHAEQVGHDPSLIQPVPAQRHVALAPGERLAKLQVGGMADEEKRRRHLEFGTDM